MRRAGVGAQQTAGIHGGRHRGDPTHSGIDVSDELVHVLEPQVGILIVEVGTHRHDDVVGAVVLGLGWGWDRSAPLVPEGNPGVQDHPPTPGSTPSPRGTHLAGSNLQEGGDDVVHVVLLTVLIHHGRVGAELVPAEPRWRVVDIGEDAWGQSPPWSAQGWGSWAGDRVEISWMENGLSPRDKEKSQREPRRRRQPQNGTTDLGRDRSPSGGEGKGTGEGSRDGQHPVGNPGTGPAPRKSSGGDPRDPQPWEGPCTPSHQ